MSLRSPLSGQATSLVLVGLMLLAIPAGLTLAQGLTTAQSATITDMTITPTLPPLNLTGTSTATPTPTKTPNGSEKPPQDDENTLLVDGDDGGLTNVDATANVEDCPEAKYHGIQEAVDDAGGGDTIVVCEGQYEPVKIQTANITLRAHGAAEIESKLPGQPALRSNATGVVIRGFTMRSPRASYVLAIGGPETLIQNNTIEVTANDSTGIFLSDGMTPAGGKSDPALNPATGSRVVSNTVKVSIEEPTRTQPQDPSNKIWRGIFTDADGTVVSGNTVVPNDRTVAIRSSGNETTISGNKIQNPDPCVLDTLNNVEYCHPATNPPVIRIGGVYGDENGGICWVSANRNKSTSPKRHNWARQNRVVNNTVSYMAGESLVFSGSRGTHAEAVAATRGIVVRGNYFYQSGGVGGMAEEPIIRNNTINWDNAYTGEGSDPYREGPAPAGICGHLDNSQITGNTMDGSSIAIRITGTNLTVKRNTATNAFQTVMLIGTRGTLGGKVVHEQNGSSVINNTASGAKYGRSGGLALGQSNFTEVAHNRIIDNPTGVSIGQANISSFHHNTITDNSQNGVVINKNVTVDRFYYNIIDNNGQLGIHKENTDKSDGQWSIFNATHNYWGCGGPSGGLRDPKTDRVANGSGDSLSASDEAGISNVRFDPFFVRPDVTCPSALSNTPEPTETATQTPTPTPTTTPTPTQTPTPGPGAGLGNGNGTGGSGGSGTGGSSGNGTGGTEGNGGPGGSVSGESTTTASPPPQTVTATSTPTPTHTISPTPRVEPGFGLLTWLVGGIILSGIVALRGRVAADMEADE